METGSKKKKSKKNEIVTEAERNVKELARSFKESLENNLLVDSVKVVQKKIGVSRDVKRKDSGDRHGLATPWTTPSSIEDYGHIGSGLQQCAIGTKQWGLSKDGELLKKYSQKPNY